MLCSLDCLAVAGFDVLVFALSQIDHIWESSKRCFRRVQELALAQMPYDQQLPV